MGSEVDIKFVEHVRKQFGYCLNKSVLFLTDIVTHSETPSEIKPHFYDIFVGCRSTYIEEDCCILSVQDVYNLSDILKLLCQYSPIFVLLCWILKRNVFCPF